MTINIKAIYQHYYTFIKDGDIYDDAFNSASYAQEKANDLFAEQCQDNGGFIAAVRQEEPIEIIRFYTDDDGEMIIVERKPAVAEYEYYHGDLAEHGTWGS